MSEKIFAKYRVLYIVYQKCHYKSALHINTSMSHVMHPHFGIYKLYTVQLSLLSIPDNPTKMSYRAVKQCAI